MLLKGTKRNGPSFGASCFASLRFSTHAESPVGIGHWQQMTALALAGGVKPAMWYSTAMWCCKSLSIARRQGLSWRDRINGRGRDGRVRWIKRCRQKGHELRSGSMRAFLHGPSEPVGLSKIDDQRRCWSGSGVWSLFAAGRDDDGSRLPDTDKSCFASLAVACVPASRAGGRAFAIVKDG